LPVGRGPSGKRWPRWPPHLAHVTSVRTMPWLVSLVVSTALSLGAQNEGQPEPLSYLVLESNKGSPQPAQRKTPVRFSLFSGLVKGRSVPCWRSTWCCIGSSSCCHSVSDFSILLSFMTPSKMAKDGDGSRLRQGTATRSPPPTAC